MWKNKEPVLYVSTYLVGTIDQHLFSTFIFQPKAANSVPVLTVSVTMLRYKSATNKSYNYDIALVSTIPLNVIDILPFLYTILDPSMIAFCFRDIDINF